MRTVFLVRCTFSGLLYIDSSFSWPDLPGGALQHIEVVARMEGRSAHDVAEELYPQAVEGARVYEHMRLRTRFNSDIRGPFIVTTDEVPTDDELIAWFESTQLSKETQ